LQFKHIKPLFKYAKHNCINLYFILLLEIELQMLLFLEDKKYQDFLLL